MSVIIVFSAAKITRIVAWVFKFFVKQQIRFFPSFWFRFGKPDLHFKYSSISILIRTKSI